MKNPDKKNWIILEIVRDYLYSHSRFQSIYKKYKAQTLSFDDVEEFVTDKDPTVPLFNLKESCHMLFRYQGEEQCSDEEKLLDLAVGSIFHEAMKLRENLYQLTVYKPRYLQIQNSQQTSDYERTLLQEFMKIGAKTEKRLAESMTETKRLLQDTLEQLAHLLPRYKYNAVLLKFLLRNKELLQQVFGRRRGLKIIADMFPGGLGEAYDVEGRSYLASEHYDLAAEFFSQAQKYGPHDQGLKCLYLYARGMDGYYKNRYQDTLRSFYKLLPFVTTVGDGKVYLKKVEEVCRKIGREYLEDKKRKLGTVALQLADKVRNLLIER
jgi:tetratricopeptide (TPR) repeat protein